MGKREASFYGSPLSFQLIYFLIFRDWMITRSSPLPVEVAVTRIERIGNWGLRVMAPAVS